MLGLGAKYSWVLPEPCLLPASTVGSGFSGCGRAGMCRSSVPAPVMLQGAAGPKAKEKLVFFVGVVLGF